MPVPLTPTILLAAASLALLCGRQLPLQWNWIFRIFFLLTCLVASGFLITEPVVQLDSGDSPLIATWKNDPLACSEQWIVIGFGICIGGFLFGSDQAASDRSRTYGFLLFVLAGLFLVATANDFLSLGLSMEVVNLALMSWQRLLLNPPGVPRVAIERDAIEPAFIMPEGFAWLSSAWIWLGIALLSNATATTNFDELRALLVEMYDPSADRTAVNAPSRLILLGTGLISIGLFLRMWLLPFQRGFFLIHGPRSRWICLFGLMASQLAGLFPLIRLLGHVLVGLGQPMVVLMLVVVLSTFAMAILMALRSFSPGTMSMRDLVASLILLQSGMLGIGLMTIAMELTQPTARWGAFQEQSESVSVLVFSLITYLLAGCGLCAVLSHLASNDRPLDFFEDFKGLGHYAPLSSLAIVVALMSVAGFPWTAGFWARWMTLLAGHNFHLRTGSSIFSPHQGVRLAIVVGMIANVFLFAAIIRLMREIVLESPLARPVARSGRGPLIAGLMAAAGSVLLGIAPQMVLLPLRQISSPRAVAPRAPERGSGRNSLGILTTTQSCSASD